MQSKVKKTLVIELEEHESQNLKFVLKKIASGDDLTKDDNLALDRFETYLTL